MESADSAAAPVLLCFDGSDDAIRAIAKAGELFGPRPAVLLTVWEPMSVWEPYDPGAVLSAAVAKLGERELGLDEVAREVAEEKLQRGIEVANAAGFTTTPRLFEGKPWKGICEVANELAPAAIVLGARGLSRMQSALLGGVSAAVVVHARQPVLVIPPAEQPSS